jgi:hypothetical protein
MLTIQKNVFFLKNCITKLRVLKWLLSLRKSTEQFVIFLGGPCIYLTLPNNKQNNWYWGDSAQEYDIKVPLHYKLLVWYATSAKLWSLLKLAEVKELLLNTDDELRFMWKFLEFKFFLFNTLFENQIEKVWVNLFKSFRGYRHELLICHALLSKIKIVFFK